MRPTIAAILLLASCDCTKAEALCAASDDPAICAQAEFCALADPCELQCADGSLANGPTCGDGSAPACYR